jgi:hypothetical protein
VTIKKNTFKNRNKGTTLKPREVGCGYLDIVS